MLLVFCWGEYLIWETQSEWFNYSETYLQSAKVFHNLISLSAPADKICLLSGEKATVNTSLVCPLKILEVLPDLKSHNLRVLSQEEDKTKQFS